MTPARRLVALLLLTLCPRLVLAQAPPAGPPVAPVRPVTDTYFGTQVTDPYRWMENLDDPAVKAWFRGQADYTQAQLARLPGRAALLARIRQLDSASASVGGVQIVPGRVFYRKRLPTDDKPKLYVREGLTGAERVLFDPEALTKNGVHYSADYFTPSLDGKYVVYGVSPGGSEMSVIHVLETDTGKDLGESIDRGRFGSPSWRPDGRSFFYNRLQPLASQGMVPGFEEKSRVYLHVLGADPDKDSPVFGYGLSPSVPLAPSDIPFISVLPASPYAFGVVNHGVQNEITLYAARLDSVAGASTPWRKIADVPDAVTGFDARGDDLYLLTHKGASRFQVIRTSLRHPDLARATVVVPPSGVVVQGVSVAKDALYVNDLDGGVGRLRRVAFGGGTPQPVALPLDGIGLMIAADSRLPGVLFEAENAIHAPQWYSYDPTRDRIADTTLEPPSPTDTSSMVVEEVRATAPDGTLIPLTIVRRRDTVLDGSRPALLDGYGSYGITNEAFYYPPFLAWVERGGVLAFAHVRGGGEYGEDWHLTGQKQTKPNTWHDFLACAQYLIDRKYTSPARLAGSGTSAGGILISRSITERPDLFGAALIRVGWSDMLRTELTPNGPNQIPEFGSFTTADGFKSLYEMDGYLHVKDGVTYPAVLLTTGINDPRVSPWEPAKMTARLQAATSSGKPVLLRVDYDAGHGFGSTKAQQDAELTDEFSFLLWQFGDPAFQPAAPGSLVNAITPVTVTGE